MLIFHLHILYAKVLSEIIGSLAHFFTEILAFLLLGLNNSLYVLEKGLHLICACKGMFPHAVTHLLFCQLNL